MTEDLVADETKRASKLMAQLYAAAERGYPAGSDPQQRDHEISVILARVLFLLFSDEVEFPGAGGGIFGEQIALPALDGDYRDAVLAASAVDWSIVSPAIFGSMLQSVRDARTRRELGEHYTSEENILKTLNPLFLDELRAEFERSASRPAGRHQKLNDLWKRLGDIRYLDPACGCGNFIIVAYRELRDLELRIMDALATSAEGAEAAARDRDWARRPKVTLDHFYGIEIDEWPARIAETAMFLIDRQCDLKLKERFGVAPERLPVQKSARIVVGSALELDWSGILEPSENVVVAGNPPFLGISLRSARQTGELQAVWGHRYHGTLDYVTGWHARALAYFGAAGGRWAFVSTNSITQGEAVAPLFRPIFDAGWQIAFAHRTFKWTSEASGQAAVHCVIVGFERSPAARRLFNYLTPDGPPVEVEGVKNITPYLTDGPVVIVDSASRPVNPQLGEVSYGNKPTDGGWLIVEPDALAAARADPIAAKYLRPYVGARELLHGGERYCLWLADSTATERSSSPFIAGRVANRRAFLLDSDAAATREYASKAHLFRQITQPAGPYLCIPAHVSAARPYFLAAHFAPDVITSNANFLSEDADGMVFAVISSTMFMVWQRAVGGRIKSDIRFNKLLSWNTFPLPALPDADRAAIIAAGKLVLAARTALGEDVPLADMYPAGGLDPDLRAAHRALDDAVDAAFGLRQGHDAAELQRLDILFGRYRALTGGLPADLNRRSRRRARGTAR